MPVSEFSTTSKDNGPKAWLVVNATRACQIDKVREETIPFTKKRGIVIEVEGKEYRLPPDTKVKTRTGIDDFLEMNFCVTLGLEDALDYVAAGILPPAVSDVFKAEPAPLNVDDMADAYSQVLNSFGFPNQAPMIMSQQQALDLGFITKEQFDEVDMSFPSFTAETLNDGFPNSIEDTYGFGILDEAQAVAVAKNVKANLQGWPNEPSAVALLERKAELEQALAAKRKELRMALAESLLGVTLDSIALREV